MEALKARIEAAERVVAELYAQREQDIADLLWDGWTLQAVADHYGMTKQRVSQIRARMTARVTIKPETPAQRRTRALHDAMLAQHAQNLRAENYGSGYAEETAAFYGDESVAQADVTERRISRKQLADSLSLAAEHRAYLDSLERAV